MVIDLILDGEFVGGFITLGLSKKVYCLTEGAEGIPKMELRKVEVDVGKNTRDCVLGGAYLETKLFLKGVLKLWEEKFGKLKVVLTGGDGELFKELGRYEPLLPHLGLKKLAKEKIFRLS